MALDLNIAVQQAAAMAQEMSERRQQASAHLSRAAELLATVDPLALEKRRQEGKFTWLAAGLNGDMTGRAKPPTPPQDYTVLAVDGSHIDVDRHSPARFHLINIGWAALRYGARPSAWMASRPTLYTQESDLALADPSSTQEVPVEGPLLGVKRAVEEARALAELARDVSPDVPLLALLDGSLVLWPLASQGYPDFVRHILLDEGFLKAMDSLQEVAQRPQRQPMAVASYISLPRSADVVSALRLAQCPYPVVNCDHYCKGLRSGARPCDTVAGIIDRQIFSSLLQPGERSSLFRTTSSIVAKRYGQHQVHFYYLNAGEEIARVEMPAWVARDRKLVELTHAVLLEQCHKGQGYPVALSESHEQAVLTGADRELFARLVEEAMVRQQLPTGTSAKAQSKRTRYL